uniref:Protein kinase domain-containing protein n=1 Tax=Strombidium rassoulzadegani TaxID=1082188 RepID=A0A7S3CNF7_9SPIT|mmetsp:Transcript_18340/g.31364  ORF Transcript_18340/g.31364 Transcript_18340/m.31364 type:complete len:176 (+) Transcript_18340:1-528(+)
MDIKLENILISKEGILKFCDFGFSMPVSTYVTRKMGSSFYMAPEIYEASQMPCKAQQTDIFSLGVLFFMMAFGAPPFSEATMNDGFFSFIKLRPGNTDFFKFHPHTRQLFRAKAIPENFQRLLLAMLMHEPSKRVQRVQDLREFDFFKESEQDLCFKDMEFGAKRLIQHEVMVQC